MLICFTYPPEITPYPALIAGGTHMAEYRAYLIGDDGHFYGAVPLICADSGFQGGNRRRRRIAGRYDARPIRIQSGRRYRIDCRGARRNRVARIER
jgi:hypothetical protein